ncbi:MAG TPA: hypothetical protein VH300_04965 [Thermoleophilaceae bacterium]|nr:hypothetical protein [Thermoleophilaceae bacterium]
MIASIVRWAAILACAFVTLSFLFFAVNQTSTASKNQANAITGDAPEVKPESITKLPNPPPAVEKVRERENDKFHEFVDDVDDVLLAPFTGISNSSSIWVRRLIPLALALLIYGIGGLYLARALGLRRW